jgi:hypothetical protein
MKIYKLCIALAAVTFLSGCASLRIDVDVYKGPLFNEQSVQRQQLISMALASKVLLEAELNEQEQRTRCNSADASHELKLRCKLLSEIISLYRPKSSEDEQAFLKAKMSLANFLKLQKQKTLLFDDRSKANKKSENNLQQGILNYIAGQRSPKSVLDELRKVGPFALDSKDFYSSADFLELLADKSVRPKIKEATKLNATDWVEFEKRIDSFVAIYFEQRADLNRMSEAMLINGSPSERNPDASRYQNYVGFENTYLLAALQLRNLACAFELTRNEPIVAAVRTRLVEQKNRAILGGIREIPSDSWSDKDYDKAKEELRYLLNRQDRSLVLDALRLAHNRFKHANEDEIRSCKTLAVTDASKLDRSDLERVLSKVARRSGVFSTTIYTSGTNRDLPEKLASLVPDLEALSTGVTAGRVEAGIDQLSNDFVKAQSLNEKPNFTTLGKAIIGLGERMRYLAVNWWIVDANVGSGDNLGFKTTLEAVGNALVSQSNEAVARDNYDSANARLAGYEKDAMNAAFPRDSKSLMDRLLSDLKDRKDKIATDNKALATSTKTLNEQLAAAKTAKDNAKAASEAASEKLNSQIEIRVGALYTAFFSREQAYSENFAKPLKASLDEAKSSIEIADKKTLDAVKAELGSSVKATDSVASWLAIVKSKSQLANDSDATSARSMAYKSTLKFVEARLAAKGKSAPATLKDLGEQALSFLNDAPASIKATSKAVDLAAATLTTATAEFTDIETKIKKLEQTTDVARFESAIKLVASFRDSFVANVGPAPFEDLNVFYGKLKTFLKEKDSASATADVYAAIDSVKVVQTRTTIGNTPQEMLDALYSELSLRHIEAVASMGSASSKAISLAEAAQRVKDRRAELVYLRPAASYLRSIHNSILSQTQAGLKWRNSLSDQAVKSIPLIGPSLWDHKSGGAIENVSPAIAESIDKANWQTINSVTLNGGGYSNYVVAKDDIGNWYVKALGSDPAKMIQSAKNLLLFNLGGRIDQNLLELNDLKAVRRSQLEKGGTTEAIDSAIASNQATTSAGGAAFDALLTKYKERYSSELEKEFVALKESISKKTVFNNAIKAAETASNGLSDADALAIKNAIEGASGSFPEVNLFENGTLQISVKRAETLNGALVALKEWASVAKKAVQGAGNLTELEKQLTVALKDQADKSVVEKVKSAAVLESKEKDPVKVQAIRAEYESAKSASDTAAATVIKIQGEIALKNEKLASINSAIDKAVITDVVKPTIDRRKAAIKDIEKAVLIVSEAAGL